MFPIVYPERSQDNLWCPFLPSTLSETVSCSVLCTPGQLAHELLGTFLSLPSWHCVQHHCVQFCVGSGDPNSSPNACKTMLYAACLVLKPFPICITSPTVTLSFTLTAEGIFLPDPQSNTSALVRGSSRDRTSTVSVSQPQDS